MTISEEESQCHPQARFWFPLANCGQFEMFLAMNCIEIVDNKKTFGILVASCIIQLRQ